MVQHVKGNLRLAPALIQMEKEANALAPKRSKASDGSFPSAAHTAANPTSDHETGDALDLTTDSPRFDIAERFRLIVARRDRRVKYLIHNGTIWKSYANRGHPPWHPQPYTGPNSHKAHGHTSVKHEHRNDTSLWWPELEDDMTKDEHDLLIETHTLATAAADGVAALAADVPDNLADQLGELRRNIRTIAKKVGVPAADIET